MKYKNVPYFVSSIEGRQVTGICCVHGNIDSWGEMSINGSWQKALTEGRKRVRYLWNHLTRNPPIASIRGLREVGREELPQKVLEWAPEATGGIEVVREYYEGVELSEWVFKSILAGDIDEQSYAYDVSDYEVKEINEQKVFMIKEIELFDVSDVLWGMNPATAGVKALLESDSMTFTQHTDAVVSAVSEYLDRVIDRCKFRADEGRTLSAPMRSKLEQLAGDFEGILEELKDTDVVIDPEVVRLKMQAARTWLGMDGGLE